MNDDNPLDNSHRRPVGDTDGRDSRSLGRNWTNAPKVAYRDCLLSMDMVRLHTSDLDWCRLLPQRPDQICNPQPDLVELSENDRKF